MRYLKDISVFKERYRKVHEEMEVLALKNTTFITYVMADKLSSESGKVNLTRVVHIPKNKIFARKPSMMGTEFSREVMPLALFCAAKRSREDLAAASALADGSLHGEFFERRIVSFAL